MKNLRQKVAGSEPFRELISRLRTGDGERSVRIGGVSGSLPAFVSDAIFRELSRQVLVVAPDDEVAEKLRDDCSAFPGAGEVKLFGTRPLHQAQALDISASIARIETLEALSRNGKIIVVASPRSLSEPVPLPDSFRNSVITLKRGSTEAFEGLISRLGENGFERKDFVGGYGDYSVRGGIIDVYPFSGDNPVRVEFWGDRIDSIREFEALSQRSIREMDSATIVPDVAEKIPATEETDDGDATGPDSGADTTPDDGSQKGSILAYLDPRAVIILLDPEFIRAEFDEMTSEGIVPGISFEELNAQMNTFDIVECTSLTATNREDAIDAGSVSQPAFNGNLGALLREIEKQNTRGYDVRLTCDSATEAKRLGELLTEHITSGTGEEDVEHEQVRPVLKETDYTPQRNVEYRILTSSLHGGFIHHASKLAVFTEHEIFGRLKQRGSHRRRRFRGITRKELMQLRKGDFVVHTDHGIGKFAGLTRIRVGGVEQEVAKMLFLGDDALYVNLNYVNRIQKYVSSEGHVPTLHRLGGGEWEKTKSRAKKRIKDIARDIITLYARRKTERGFAFSADAHWQKELEASFLFEDTPDQAAAVSDVKKDMEENAPMDRLICGDVGFGKTEVAVRAAFKAVLDGKQVAVLVPTTILAHQHANTFRDRLSRYTTRVENLTRFKSKKEQDQIVRELAAGGVDIVIGTHRLLSKDIAFSDLGLLIIDEEHRFGVSAKEKLRKLKTTVDTLAMTATPIPRTLQFSLIGSRDLSLITTAPRNRLAVNTEIVPAETESRGLHRDVIREAIIRELHRGGQIYVVHDRVSGLDAVAGRVAAIVPEARVQIAHGQMAGHELEKAMLGFMEKRSNVLVCTKIIESGLDIPNVNTIIVNRADRFGLAELYQLRGRVGRSNVQAYAYFLTPPLVTVPRQTLRRLQALEEFTELGSGFNLAMRDLEIRGAGNLLGGEQSGFVAEMGFETYERVIIDAVDELKREEFSGAITPGDTVKQALGAVETVVETDVEALIPEIYIASDTERLDIYRRLYRTAGREELLSMRDELRDRFGEYPGEVENLFRIVELKQAAAAMGLPKVALSGDTFTMTLPGADDGSFYGEPDTPDSPFQRLVASVNGQRSRRVNLRETEKGLTLVVAGITGKDGSDRIAGALKVLGEVAGWSGLPPQGTVSATVK